MAHPVGAPSNSLFKILADWEVVLRDTSLGNLTPANLNDSDEADAAPVKLKGTTAARLYRRGK
jgi:hypothetical protein